MSADEIRRLAERAKELSQLPDYNFCVTTWDDENHYLVKEPTQSVRAVLLAYAAMVERCEATIRTLNNGLHENEVGILNYILKGEGDESK